MLFTARQIVALAQVIEERHADKGVMGESVLIASGPDGALVASIQGDDYKNRHILINRTGMIDRTGTRIF